MKELDVRSAGFFADGQEILLHTLRGEDGFSLTVTNLGAAAIAMTVAGRDVLLGFGALSAQLEKGPMFGATLGRYAGRICGASYTQGGREVSLSRSHGDDHAHGGCRGFDKRVFQTVHLEADCVRYRYVSPDGEEGYPGTLTLDVTYRLLAGSTVRVEYDVTSDADTICGISNHMYFNLLGNGAGNADAQHLKLLSHRYQPFCGGKPSGKLLDVANTPMDFTAGAMLSERAAQLDGDLDHDFALDVRSGEPAAVLTELKSGLSMSVYTDMPCVHVYLADFGDMRYPGKDGAVYTGRCGVCFEPMYLSDCLHSGLGEMPYLKAGETRHSETTLRFAQNGI